MKNWIYIGLILVFFLVTRLYKITEIPGSLYWDEASIGYNAYSVATTLKDEWGDMLPLHFRAFGEFKLPVYIYSVAILTKMIGVSELAVRLPAVLYGAATIILIYLLSRKVSKSEVVGIFSAFFFALSPWYFIFGRTGYEATAGLLFFVAGVYFFSFIPRKTKTSSLLDNFIYLIDL